MPKNQQVTPADPLFVLRGHIKTCIAVYDYHGVLSAEDFRRAIARWPKLDQVPMKTALAVALHRVEQLIAERDAVPEQAPAMVTGTGGGQPVPPQTPVPRP